MQYWYLVILREITWLKLTMPEVRNIARKASGTARYYRGLVSICNYVHSDHENATKRARTYGEYRGCLIEAVLGVRSESAGVLLRTGREGGYGPALLRRILKSFANYVTRIVAKAGATTTCDATAVRSISHPSRADSAIRPSPPRISQPLFAVSDT